jgi:hypothetical protein
MDERHLDEARQLAELVKFDYERTMAFIQGVVGVSANVRSIGIGGWFLLVAAAINNQRWELAAIALAAILVFGVIDAYHGWLYAHALDRATDMENALGEYARWLTRTADADLGATALAGLRGHEFGQLRNLPRFRIAMLGNARPTLVYRRLYPALVVLAAGAAVVVSDLCLHIRP